MAILGVGIDLIRVKRLRQALDRWGERFSRRVFTPVEISHCSRKANMAECLATRFAAKEAFAKALGSGLRAPILWTDIEVRNDALGKPEITLSDRAKRHCDALGVRSWHLSITDDGDYGAAVVIVET
jgi:holo-[acyl-carrier protein] synthase